MNTLRWISLEQRLPADEQFVLLTGDSGHTTIPNFITTGRRYESYRPRNGGPIRWLDVTNTPLSDKGWAPTHWTPIPNLPFQVPDVADGWNARKDSWVPVESCSNCGFGPTLGVVGWEGYKHAGHPKVDLCRFCYKTHTGSAFYCQHADQALLLRSLAGVGNVLLDAIQASDPRAARVVAGAPKTIIDVCLQCGSACTTHVHEINAFLHPECAEAYVASGGR